jgi:putative NADPH-quinone reductase
MGKRILILLGHPDPAPQRLCRLLADAYARGALAGGHELRRIDIAMLDIPVLRSQTDFEAGAPATVAAWQSDIAWAEHIVLVFPLWLGDMPAMLKAFLEQVLRPGFAFIYRDEELPEKRLGGRSARVVITMGMPAFAYRWFYFAHALRLLKRNILGFVGINPVHDTLFGMVPNADEAKLRDWCAQMEMLGRHAD